MCYKMLEKGDVLCYRSRMPAKPPTSVKSVRMRDELWAFVAERAAKRKISPNAWMVRCVDKARLEVEETAKTSASAPAYGSRLKNR